MTRAARDVHKEAGERAAVGTQDVWHGNTTAKRRQVARRPRHSATRKASTGDRRNRGAWSKRPVIRQLDEIEAAGGDGVLEFGRGRYAPRLEPRQAVLSRRRHHEGRRHALLRAGRAVPAADHQGSAADTQAIPEWHRRARRSFSRTPATTSRQAFERRDVETETGRTAERIIGGDLLTLLYTVQIGTIAVHTWQSRIQSARFADTTTIDLDPGEDVPFSAVVALAEDIKSDLDELDLDAGVKTSGSSGMHIVLPLPAKTSVR